MRFPVGVGDDVSVFQARRKHGRPGPKRWQPRSEAARRRHQRLEPRAQWIRGQLHPVLYAAEVPMRIPGDTPFQTHDGERLAGRYFSTGGFAYTGDRNYVVAVMDWMQNKNVDDTAMYWRGVPITVSTVFVGIDCNDTGDDGPPVLWETMIFVNGDGEEQWRYASKAAAKHGHHIVVDAIRQRRREVTAAPTRSITYPGDLPLHVYV